MTLLTAAAILLDTNREWISCQRQRVATLRASGNPNAKFDVPNECKEVCKKNSLIMQTKGFTMPGHCETLGLHYQTVFLHTSLQLLGTPNFESNALIINALGINN